MSYKDMDGQLDFLGLISEYTDDQGAHVKVRNPGVKRSKPIPPPSPEQLELDFSVKDADEEFEQIKKAEDEAKAKAEAKVKAEAEAKAKAKAEAEAKAKAEAEAKAKAEAEAKAKAEAEAKAKAEAEAKAKAEAEAKAKAEAEAKAKAEAEAKTKEAAKPKPIPKAQQSSDGSGIMNFKQCVKCWCSDCKHNALGKAVPRDICGVSMPCPACQGCIDEDTPTICEIGNAREGCMTRALEEGLVVSE